MFNVLLCSIRSKLFLKFNKYMEIRSKVVFNSKNRFIILLLASMSLLLVPAVAMLFSSEVVWTPYDFAIATVVLLGTVLLAELILRMFPRKKQRIYLIALLFILLGVLWTEMAVGVFGSPIAGT